MDIGLALPLFGLHLFLGSLGLAFQVANRVGDEHLVADVVFVNRDGRIDHELGPAAIDACFLVEFFQIGRLVSDLHMGDFDEAFDGGIGFSVVDLVIGQDVTGGEGEFVFEVFDLVDPLAIILDGYVFDLFQLFFG